MSHATRNPAWHLIFSVSFSRGTWLIALFAALWLGSAAIVHATPIEPTVKELLKQVERPATTFIPARVGWSTPEKQPPYFNLALEQYGPQATVRAVRASLKAALTPDPVAMAALLFCAFALRWMRLRKEQPQVHRNPELAPADISLPKTA
jgi:hypothetical protein